MFFEKKHRLFIGRFPYLHTNHYCHGFSTRKGGISRPPYDSLNLGGQSADDPADVLKNRQAFFGALEIDPEQLAIPEQVHGDHIAYVDSPGYYAATDGLITDVKDIRLTVLVADCVAIYLLDPPHHAAGLVHAGWRGSRLGIVWNAVENMRDRFGSDPGRMLAWMGPSIGSCCYRVGNEVASQFPAACIRDHHLDLQYSHRLQLEAAGLPAGSITNTPLCTQCHPEFFYSHRGGKGKTGRMMAVFGL